MALTLDDKPKWMAMLVGLILAAGAVFGVLIYLFMNFVVIPMSAFPYKFPYTPMRLLEGFASHAALVGIPIAAAARWLVLPRGGITARQ